MSNPKPATTEAMLALISSVRQHLPFHVSPADLCQHSCSGCPKKLMEFLDTELSDHEQNLATGHIPTLGEISKLARTSRKIHAVMVKNGLAYPHAPKPDQNI